MNRPLQFHTEVLPSTEEGPGFSLWAMQLTLRWLKTVSSTFQDIDFDGSLLPLFISGCYHHDIKKKCPITGEHVGIIFIRATLNFRNVFESAGNCFEPP